LQRRIDKRCRIDVVILLRQAGGKPTTRGYDGPQSARRMAWNRPGPQDQATFDKLAEAADKGCPVAKVLNAEITLTKTLK
jgi:organic hydroperoxide reductase OsmC/OhrA